MIIMKLIIVIARSSSTKVVSKRLAAVITLNRDS